MIEKGMIDLSRFTEQRATLGASKWYDNANSCFHISVPATEGDSFRITAAGYTGSEGTHFYNFISEGPGDHNNDDTIATVTGTPRKSVATYGTVEETAPAGTRYLVLSVVDGAKQRVTWELEKL